MSKIGVGIIGAGSIADIGHCPSIEALPNAYLAALCDTNTEFLDKMSRKWNPKKTYVDYHDMLEDKDVQVVIVGTPNRLHAQEAIDAMRAKKHVIVEKPFACTHAEAWKMVDVCHEEGVFLMAGTNQRFWEQNMIARKLIDDGFIGKPQMGRSSLHEGWSLYHEQLSFTRFRQNAHEAGAGALFDLGAHRADLLMYLMGSRPKRVMGIIKAFGQDYTELDDSFWITIEFENGATGVISGDRYSPAVSNISEVYGTEGTIFTGSEATNPFQTAPLAVFTNKDFKQNELPEIVREYRYPQLFWSEDIMQPNGHVPKRWVPIYPKRGWAYKTMLEHFLHCVETGTAPSLTPEDSALVTDVLVGAYLSMKTNSWVEVGRQMENYIVPHYDAPEIR
ncbi:MULTISPECIES: Gfo/Idh/MocA family protein [Anaerotruncus]|jgi:predicted dehydrogenase|uniref:Gfo/Idh/MocA family oxidoreductase n=1 Tax=Anaerotruncus colihominis TaxID=169435 RepID=A0A845RFF0_9FIRM|nr:MULTISPECIES: Gfo/Idh/MocA family oxidoreductase [Anaerotruncus]MCI8493057.1 Gfo/Idh/MocA family oxidoreductase [Anaerotruncus sp.]MCR2024104.1 Gfo/Idh/MocA family oxidoreductase [Anaerotruncus colihominis]NBI78087.1 gfo/Idh/MocA family oxidoreductase [Anaerotruncus colihominis]NDO39345.1 Gfo/Idh/MocA family oxidoreductase [Anaerotruncus colihominis]